MKISFSKLLSAVIILPILVSCSYLSFKEKISKDREKINKKNANLMLCQTNCLRLVKDQKNRTNSLGNPIYILEAYRKGQKMYAFQAVTGRANSQNRSRHRSGTEAPLPDGKYLISNKIVPGLLRETGKTFIPIYPTFSTGRTNLGIHYDPSYNKNNGEDGTAGCIGLINKKDRDLINQFVVKYKPQELIVIVE